MSDIWLVSDTHFGHEKIIQYYGRPFENAAHMDEELVERWNSVVKQDDVVYHLGDVGWGTADNKSVLFRLNGRRKYLLLGNHDDAKCPILAKVFRRIKLWLPIKELGLLCTHIPVHTDQLEAYGWKANAHGHIHERCLPDPRYINLCVEQNNYTPVHIDAVVSKIPQASVWERDV